MRSMGETGGSGRKFPGGAQNARLAAALRENLKRRKAQARARKQEAWSRSPGSGEDARADPKPQSDPDD